MTSQLHNRSTRLWSIDVLRGIVMIIMALDHTRDYFHVSAMTVDPLDLSATTTPVFFTRWITHFCAPIFVFLSGMSAYLNGERKSKKELSLFLIKRGFWLILVEIFVISLLLSFNPLYNFILLQVIWAIGWGMILLGLLIRGSYTLVVLTGLLLFFGHNLSDYAQVSPEGFTGILWDTLLQSPGRAIFYAPQRLILLAYAILPWTGIMLLGYAFGKIISRRTEAIKRKRSLILSGVLMILLFVGLRLANGYGDPAPWLVQPDPFFSVLSFINVNKYPPSLMFALMTIGPALIFLGLSENQPGAFGRFLAVYGSVPFFYYVLHFFLIHLLLVIAFFIDGRTTSEIVDNNSPFLFRPVLFGFSLPVVYGVWMLVILLLYYPCRWFRRYKQTHTQWWLSYL